MDKIQQIRAWTFLLEQIGKVRDHKLRRALSQEYRERAQQYWGWCPDGVSDENLKPDLTPEEKEFYEAIQAAIKFDIDIREDLRPETESEFSLNMLEFVRDGGMLYDIPEDIRTPTVVQKYYEILHYLVKDALDSADNIINEGA